MFFSQIIKLKGFLAWHKKQLTVPKYNQQEDNDATKRNHGSTIIK